jgi:hypothetical protein
VRQVNTKALRQALERVGISDFRWHDQRHTWASWYVQAGTLLHVQQELGSWERMEMIRKYAHLASDHLAQYAPLDQLCLSPQCGFSSTVHGNDIAVEAQRQKLALIVETAREVWG